MQKCNNCNNDFRYVDILKSIWLGRDNPVVCRKCNAEYYSKLSSRLIISFIIFLPLIIINARNIIYMNDSGKDLMRFPIYAYIIWVIIIGLLLPFFVRYNIKTGREKYKDMSLLVSNLKNTEAEVIISILKSYDIPFLKKSDEMGATEILTGSNIYGIDIYVQPHILEIARELINTDNIV